MFASCSLRVYVGMGSTNALRLGLSIGAALLSGAAVASAASAVTPSTNWAGYLARPSAAVGSRFSSVSGSWTVPSATCEPGRESYSAAWVGLGGAGENARALEQIGTDADCGRSGRAAYSGWYELIPAGSVNLAIAVHPGDHMSASVTVFVHGVTLRLRDLSSGARFSRTVHVSRVDVSSAEWIVEAPSICLATKACGTLALTNFSTLTFSSATAIAGAQTGPIADRNWSATALELRQAPAGESGPGSDRRPGEMSALITAAPLGLSPSSGAFSVSWSEQQVQSQQPNAPTLPGFRGSSG